MAIVIAGAHSRRLVESAHHAVAGGHQPGRPRDQELLGDPYLFLRDVGSPERTISLGLRFRL